MTRSAPQKWKKTSTPTSTWPFLAAGVREVVKGRGLQVVSSEAFGDGDANPDLDAESSQIHCLLGIAAPSPDAERYGGDWRLSAVMSVREGLIAGEYGEVSTEGLPTIDPMSGNVRTAVSGWWEAGTREVRTIEPGDNGIPATQDTPTEMAVFYTVQDRNLLADVQMFSVDLYPRDDPQLPHRLVDDTLEALGDALPPADQTVTVDPGSD